MEATEYLSNKKSLFHRSTEGKVLQALALKRLQDTFKPTFTTVCVGVTDGNYIVALNIPWWSCFFVWWKRKEREAVVLEWLKILDPCAKSVRIVRTAKHLAKEQVALS